MCKDVDNSTFVSYICCTVKLRWGGFRSLPLAQALFLLILTHSILISPFLLFIILFILLLLLYEWH